MPRGQKKRKAREGKAAAAKKILTELLVHFSPYNQILVPLPHLYTNAKPKFIAAVARCFNARHRSNNPVSARKTLISAPPTFLQRLIAARATLAKQRLCSVQEFGVGLVDPSVHELASSGD